MSIMAECPKCRQKQSAKNKKCKGCDTNLDRAKRSKRVRYWVAYYINKKLKRELVQGEGFNPYSIEDARVYEAKRKVQKAENRILDIKQDSKITFSELTEWYKNLEKVKAQKAFWRTEISLHHWNQVYGEYMVNEIKPVDLENYQMCRRNEGKADNTIDSEIGTIRAMVNKAFDNDLVSGDAIKAFKQTKKLLKRNANARDRILSHEEFLAACRTCKQAPHSQVRPSHHLSTERSTRKNDFRDNFSLLFFCGFGIFI
jgi:hypothetical protein